MKTMRDDRENFTKPGPRALDNRHRRQAIIGNWCCAAFGVAEATSIPQRGIRLLEEAAELAQACGVDREMAHALLDYVWARPVGQIKQEAGGVGITLLALCSAARLSAEVCEIEEARRVMDKPLEHFARRNAAKNEAGFRAESAVTL